MTSSFSLATAGTEAMIPPVKAPMAIKTAGNTIDERPRGSSTNAIKVMIQPEKRNTPSPTRLNRLAEYIIHIQLPVNIKGIISSSILENLRLVDKGPIAKLRIASRGSSEIRNRTSMARI